MPKYILNEDLTKRVHYDLQDEMFNHCEDFEVMSDDFEEAKEQCKHCDYYLACQISNQITAKIVYKEWD